ncbi:hypothetical protein [Flavobacterium hercynium]|uniref:DUF2357 domain-containing protein n=1 Tax=Flavobacterium hercynium TaxID=387094 RepID=A0A226HPP4_9FLAO|nr:hypothetical protein [Flavobacterium hercynium]OXA96112.1 hypothetical protein B0A66_00600 [Flavobacterium hercynium]SMP06062.1 hypothetical protein SAMN06265346_101593 [Flavobacterium hercynium]
MFKIFSIDQYHNAHEVYPENGIYVVYELYQYKFQFTGSITSKTIFIEDEVFDYENKLITFTENSISTKEKKRIFEDYFGYLKINICDHTFNFEVRIQKLKVPELEEILLYLWNQDPIIFDNFFSKSTLKSKLDKENQNLDYSSKFVNIFEDYYNFFKNSFFVFKSLPHNVLRTKNIIKDYETSDISNNSIDWLINNLDELHIDYSYKNDKNSIPIKNNYGVIEKILTEEKFSDFNIYENQIILGTFDYVILEIAKIKNKIKSYLSTKQYYEKDFYSINEFKIIPFLKLKDDLDKIESKIKSLQRKYKDIFVKANSKNTFPKLTPVFSNKRHYTDAYNKIRLIRDIKINLDGELNLLNIKKLSTLYERFNLFVLINSILLKNPISFKKENPKLDDNTFQEFYFQFTNYKISLYYDAYIGNLQNKIGLQRISNGYYKPDYIIKLETEYNIYFYILDSKYSSENTVKDRHLPKCINTYILDIGITNSKSTKVEELILIYPGQNEETIFGNDIFKPKISILPSKVKNTNLKNFIEKTLFNE